MECFGHGRSLLENATEFPKPICEQLRCRMIEAMGANLIIESTFTGPKLPGNFPSSRPTHIDGSFQYPFLRLLQCLSKGNPALGNRMPHGSCRFRKGIHLR